MPARVYVETTIVSYLAAQPSRDLIVAAHQALTREWWSEHRQAFALYCSQLVVREASAGDVAAAQLRLQYLDELQLLQASPAALSLAQELLSAGALPQRAADDALHIGIAAVSGMEFLLT